MAYINIHTHIFNVKCAPENFKGKLLGILLSNRFVSKPLAFIFRRIIPFSKRDLFDRYAKMIAIGNKKSQNEIFEDLASNYKHLNMKFAVLSIDMDKMEGGKIINNYETQITQLFEVKKKYPNQVLPFLSVDPRKEYNGSMYRYIKEKFDHYGFAGIKLYPALGFFPFDPKLKDCWEFAVKYDVPITCHCTKGGIYYQGKLRNEHLIPQNIGTSELPPYTSCRMKDFKNNFTDPSNWLHVLKLYPELKLCFAHFGGSSQIKKSNVTGTNSSKTNFYLKIKELLAQTNEYPNLYADISYTLSKIKKIKKLLGEDLKDKVLREKILFGTDYFLTIQEKKERKLVDDFIKNISEESFQRIAFNNCHRFLKSHYYPIN